MSQRIGTLLLLLVVSSRLAAQEGLPRLQFGAGPVEQVSDKTLAKLDKQTAALTKRIDKQTNRYISNLENEERRLKQKLSAKDSLLSNRLTGSVGNQYKQLLSRANGGAHAVYSGRLDSLTSALAFLKGKFPANAVSLQLTLEHYQVLQSKLDAAEQLRKFVEARRDKLKSEFERLGMIDELTRYRKQVYYYRQQLDEYISILRDPSKIEAKVIQVVSNLPQFKDFFARNSLMGAMFPMPSSGSNPAMAIGGLQARASVMQALTNQFGSAPNAIQMMQQNVQMAQGQLSQLRKQLNTISSGSYGSGGDADIPGFKPQTTKTQSFLSRLEYGLNVQSQKAKWMFPTTTDLGAQLGFRLNDNSSVGIGMSYKVGWGKNWNQIEITHQGVGLRSYIDWKIRGSFYLSGGYEQNFRSAFKTIDALKDQSAWQSSGLIGLSKKYSVSKKLKGNIQLLWDFLSYRQSPQPNSILFRIGYQLK